MRRIACLFLLLFVTRLSVAQPDTPVPPRPVPSRFVNDFPHVLSSAQAEDMEKKLSDYEKSDGREIVVIIMDSTGEGNAAYAGQILDSWKIGESDNGKGMVLLVDMKYKKVTTAISPGLRETLSNATCLRIINQDIVPAFEQQQYYKGLDLAINSLKIVMIPPSVLQNPPRSRSHRLLLEVVVILILVTGYFYFFIYRKPKKK